MESQSSRSDDDDAVVINCDDISNYNPEHILPESPEDIAKIRKWLQPTDYAHESGEFHKHRASHMSGTGNWLTSSAVYRKWSEGLDDGMLWVKGIPGSGKSVVAAHLIDLLVKTNPGTPVLYFFFRQIIDANHEPTALLRDWLDQVLGYSPPLQKKLKELVKAGRSMTSLSMEDFWGYLRLACAGLPDKVFCVADAMDEMDQGNDEFLQALAALGTWRPQKVKVLMTSRPVPSVEMPLRQAKMLRIRLEEDMVDTDISSYVQRGLKNSNLSSDEQIRIREAIPGRANGIFLYAKLAMDAFLEPDAQIAEVLRTLPLDLHDMYTSLLREHAIRSGVPQDIQLLILQWVTHATRPLRLLELAEMISVTYKTTDLTTAKHLVRAAAGPLLEILPNETVCVIHHSFTEYLKCVTRSETEGGYPILLPGSTHCRLALTCLEYLQNGCLDGVSGDDEDDEDDDEFGADDDGFDCYELYDPGRSNEGHNVQRVRLQYPFFGYATLNWHRHTAKSHTAGFDQKDLTAALTTFFGNKQRTKAWLKLEWANDDAKCKNITPLHIAARYGLTDYARDLVQHGADVHAGDVGGKTPLWWAAANGHADIIRLLAQAGADPDVDDKVRGLKPLHEAAKENHSEAVRALLELGVDPLTVKTTEDPGRRCGNASRSTGHTPLMYACQNGHLEALEAFLPFLTDIATVQRALAWSARNKRSKLVKRILLHPGIDVNAKVRGDTALYLACLTADRETILPILEAGGDPTILCGNYGDEFGGVGSMRYIPFGEVKDETKGHTALYALASSGRRGFGANECNPETLHELFHLLVAKGAKIDQRTESDETALHAAVNNPVMLRLLLNAGADANAVNRSGQTVLHRVTLIEAVALLVEEGKVDINKIYPYDGCTPLLTMLSQYNKDVILKLLQYRPDLSIKDKRGNGALHIALAQQNNGADIIQELLAAGADPNERNRAGETPLLVLRMENRDSAAIVDMLLKAGADINAKDASGKTLLSRAVGSQGWARDPVHADITGLLGKGADLHVRDFKGRTVLHHAIEKHEGCERDYRGKKQVTRFDFLLGLGLDVRVVDYRGNTLLHELALRGGATDFHYGAKFIPVWNQLLALGIDVNQGNQQGRTALHMQAAAKGSSYGRESYQSKYFCPIDLVLSKVKDVDQRDHQGLTALHLASTVAVANVKKLLEAGSDPTSASFDALTPLHLAARARHSNIVGLLLSSIKEDRVKAINATDAKGNTPLYYACQSGRPETVQLLLEAGADASKGTLFSACATFEDEQKLWGVDRHAADTEQNQSASGLTIGDTTRPEVPKDNDYRSTGIDDVRDSARLEEIIDMLVSHNCDLSSLLGGGSRFGESGALDQAASAGHTYTFSCLLRARDSIQPASKSRRYFASSALEEATVKAYKDADVAAATDASTHVRTGEANQAHVTRALKRRQYRVLRALFDKGVDFLAQERIRSTMEILVEHGYASLLKEIGHLEAARKLGEGKWHAFGDVGQPGLYTEVSAADVDTTQNILLLSALGRATPNMDVVRLLVEEFHVDVNQRRYSKTYIDGNYEVMPQESALHLLAKGTHWWHTALALPYLISKGADLEARDYNGNTALHIALGIGSDLGSFHREAAKALIAAGANVNTRDNKGHACFAGTVGDAEMFQLFIDAGASISADAVFRAIRSREIGVLKTLLDAGADPNVRLEPDPTLKSGKTVEFVQGEFDLPVHEVYPLYAAAKMHSVSRDNEDSATEKNMDSETAVQLVETLLAAGADPYATFYRKNPGYMDKSSDKDKTALSNPEFEQVVVLHELLVHKHLVHPILSLDTLDPNRRDSRGRSVLHMACHKNCLGSPIDSLVAVPEQDLQSSRPSFLECLRARGADMMAVDSAGSGVLHHILRNRCRLDSERDMATLRDLAKTYPGLLNQTDSSGKTPLHVAIEHAIRYHAIAPAQALLECGADAFAVDGEGNSCLHILAFGVYRSTEIRTLFTQLVGKGLDVNARNNSGETPLFNLNRDGDIQSMHFEKEDVRIDATEALDFFESLGADFFAADDEGKGLLHVAAKETVEIDENDRRLWPWSKEEHTESKPTRFQTLLGKGLDPMMEDKKKRTALDVAAACGKASVLKLYEKDSSDV